MTRTKIRFSRVNSYYSPIFLSILITHRHRTLFQVHLNVFQNFLHFFARSLSQTNFSSFNTRFPKLERLKSNANDASHRTGNS